MSHVAKQENWMVSESTRGVRLDRWVAEHCPNLSRARVQELIEEKLVLVNDAPSKPAYKLRAGDRILVEAQERPPLTAEPEAIPLQILYEDDDVLVVNKPAGLVVHPAPGHWDGTLVNGLLARAPEGPDAYGGIAGVRRPGIVHRLDRDTSGLLMVAKTDDAQASLMAQLKARRVKKTYVALALGAPEAAVGRIEAPIGRDPKNRQRMAVVSDGRAAVTGYRVRERLPGWTLLDLDLITGRTHQIRVHLAALGHPIAGDPVYGTGTSRRGPDGLGRLFLHAWRLEFTTPMGGRLVRVEAPLPADLEAVLERLRRSGDR
jgi:23S rRNA pseudouridine1911/1915/1917 synthase